MSMKILLALLPLVALCSGQTTGLDKTQELSSVPGRFSLSWSVLQTAGDIILQIQANTTGWVSLSFETATLSDIIIGGYDNNKNLPYVYDMSSVVNNGAHGPLVQDASRDVIVQRAFEYDPEIVVRYKRSLNTGDSEDVPIVSGPMTVSWAIAQNGDDFSSPLADGGVATVTFY